MVLGAALLVGAGRAPARSHLVRISGFQFVPALITAAVGDTVVWSNEDIFPHTATALTGAWDSGTIAAKGRWTLVVRAAGRVEYQCALHPSMKATVEAE
jgi:plastocyanin